MISKIIEHEYSENQILLNEIKDYKIKQRISYNLKWFIKNAVKAKYFFYILTIITVVSPVASGILLNISDGNITLKVISSIMLGISSISSSFLAIFDFKKMWLMYRNQAEQIKHMLSEYIVSKHINEEELLKDIEKNIKITDRQWGEILKKK